MKAILLVSHGSRCARTRQEVLRLCRCLGKLLSGHVIEFAFLDVSRPTISQGVDICVRQGADEIVVALNFLNAGRHVDKDVPAIIRACRKKYPNVKFAVTRPLGTHPQLPGLFVDLIENALSK